MGLVLIRPVINMETRLRDIPDDWLKFVEPKIIRGSFLPCWVWTGRLDRNGYPVLRHPLYGHLMAHRFVAGMFWQYPENWFVTRTCHRINCLNPGHLVCQAESPRWAPAMRGA